MLDRKQMSIWRMHNACWKTKATNTHSEYIILLFHSNSGCMKSPQFYMAHTLPVFLFFRYSRKMKYLQKLLRRQIRHCNYMYFYKLLLLVIFNIMQV